MRAATLLYHDVVNDGRYASSGFQGAGPDRYKLDLREFDGHLRALEKSMTRPPASVEALDRESQLPWLLTFDDGGASALRTGEILAEKGWPGHFFVTVDYIDTDGFLTGDAIRALDRMGHVIGSHSCSHPDRMAHCTSGQLQDEWSRSVRALGEIVGHPVTVASVPGGDYGKNVARAAAASGIMQLFTSEPVLSVRDVDGCSVFGRFSILRGELPDHVAELAAGRRALIWSQFTSWQAKKAAKAVGGRHYLKLRRLVLEKRR